MLDRPEPVEGFDEDRYLMLNPDVREAVQNGQFDSGWHHYVRHGFAEGRPGVTPEVYSEALDLLAGPLDHPVPPPHLRHRVNGSEDLLAFLHIGQTIASELHAAITYRIALDPSHQVLDFGCGCGRVLRHIQPHVNRAALHGSDVDAEAISWCQENLSDIGQFGMNEPSPPLDYPDASFDVVYSVSVFTHLAEDAQFLWLDELARITRPGGILLLSTHGPHLSDHDDPNARKNLQNHGFHCTELPRPDGPPECNDTNSFHTHAYILHNWVRYFEIETILTNGVARLQDLVICRQRE